MPLILFFLGATALGLMVAKAKRGALQREGANEGLGIGARAQGRTYRLDVDLPPALRQRVLTSLTSETSGAALFSFAKELGYDHPLASAALARRAIELGFNVFCPPEPTTPAPVIPTPLRATPTRGPVTPASPRAPASPGGPQATSTPLAKEYEDLNPLEASEVLKMPDPPRAQVLTALSNDGENDPTALEAFAKQMEAQGFGSAATMLRTKITVLRLAEECRTRFPGRFPP